MKRTRLTLLHFEISKTKSFEIYDESSLSNTSSDTIVNQENSRSSDNNNQDIPNEVTSNSDNTENDISQRAYLIKNYTKVPKINDLIYKSRIKHT